MLHRFGITTHNLGMTFIVQTQINIAFNDRQSEFDGFEPLTVGLTLWVDLNFRDQMFHQLFAFKGIHHIVELFKADENFVNVIACDFIRFDSLLLCTGILIFADDLVVVEVCIGFHAGFQ